MTYPKVTVIVPVRNEKERIVECVERILAQSYPRDRLEVLVIDGGSEDGTREIIQDVARRDGFSIRLLENSKGERAAALNIGIQAATGDVIVRVDARALIPSDYVERCVKTLDETGADNVGGVQQPIARSATQEAIGMVLSHPFGIGNAAFRLGKQSGYVDTVYLGCFRREVFARVGLFDEQAAVISEDSDLNQRIRAAGGKVYLNAAIRVPYYPRETLKGFWQIAVRYGDARAGNLLKHRRLTSWRQAAPPAFLLVLLGLAALSVWDHRSMVLLAGMGGMYLITDALMSSMLCVTRRAWGLFPRLLLAFPCMHFGWASGFWMRLLAAPLAPSPVFQTGSWARPGSSPLSLDAKSQRPEGSGTTTDAAPLVSVIMPAYNTAAYIGEALESVFAQTFHRYEVIVVNDGSPDTPALERALLPYRHRIVYVAQPNRGPSSARNAGIRAARGRLIALLDSDDVWDPEYLAVHVRALEADPMIDVIYSNALYFGDSPAAGRTFMEFCPSDGEVTFERLITQQCNVFISATARREAIIRAGMFDESQPGSEDFDLWLRVVKQGGRIAYHRRVLVGSRRRQGSLSADMGRYVLRAMDKAERTLNLTAEEREAIRRTRPVFRANLRFHEGKQAFLRGDTAAAVEALEDANGTIRSRRIELLLVLMRVVPRLLLWAYRIRLYLLQRARARFQLNAARFSPGPAHGKEALKHTIA